MSQEKKIRTSTNERLKSVLGTDEKVREAGKSACASLEKWLLDSSKTPVRILAEETFDMVVKAVVDHKRAFADVRKALAESLSAATGKEKINLQTPEFKNALVECARERIDAEKSESQRKKTIREFLREIGAEIKTQKEADDATRLRDLEARNRELEKTVADLKRNDSQQVNDKARIEGLEEMVRTLEVEKGNMDESLEQSEQVVASLSEENRRFSAEIERLKSELAMERSKPRSAT